MFTPNDRVTFGIEYLHSEYDSFVPTQPSAPIGTLCPRTTLSAGPPPRIAIDCSGFPMMRSPKWAGSYGYEHRFDFANSGDLTVGADMTFASSIFTSIDFSPVVKDPGYVVLNAEITYQAKRSFHAEPLGAEPDQDRLPERRFAIRCFQPADDQPAADLRDAPARELLSSR